MAGRRRDVAHLSHKQRRPALDEKRAEYVEKRDKAALPSTKALYQAFIDAIDRIKERLAIEGE